MKAIMISIKPEWVAKILNGKKTIEIRKSMPKCDLPIDVYIYCTKGKDLMFYNGSQYMVAYGTIKEKRNHKYNGKVVAKFTLNKVEKILEHITNTYMSYCTNSLNCDEFFKKSCLTIDELEDYLNWNNGGYAWHISNLEIFDEPKELGEFRKYYRSKGYPQNQSWYLTKAPQSWCYCEEL